MAKDSIYTQASNRKHYLKNIELDPVNASGWLFFFIDSINKIVNIQHSSLLANDIVELCLSTSQLLNECEDDLLRNIDTSLYAQRVFVALNYFRNELEEHYVDKNKRHPYAGKEEYDNIFEDDNELKYEIKINPNPNRLNVIEQNPLPYLPEFLRREVSNIQNLTSNFVLELKIDDLKNKLNNNDTVARINTILLDSQKIYDNAKKIETDVNKQISSAQKIANEILAEARNNLAKKATAGFCELFLTQADSHREAAKTWLKYVGVSAVVTLIIAFVFLCLNLHLTINQEDGSTLVYSFNNNSIAFITTKITILLIFISITLWLGRMYRTTKHLEYINTHKAKSLESLLAFVQAVDDSTIRDAIVLEAARSIYSTPDTGLTASSGDSGDQIKYVEILKNINPKN